MTTANTPYWAGKVTPDSDDATEPASNGGTQVPQNIHQYFATVVAHHKTGVSRHANDWSNLRSVGDLLRKIGGRR